MPVIGVSGLSANKDNNLKALSDNPKGLRSKRVPERISWYRFFTSWNEQELYSTALTSAPDSNPALTRDSKISFLVGVEQVNSRNRALSLALSNKDVWPEKISCLNATLTPAISIAPFSAWIHSGRNSVQWWTSSHQNTKFSKRALSNFA